MDFTKKLTTITATNLTIVNNEDNNSNLIKEAVLLKHKSNFNLSKSVVCGFNNVVTIAESDTNLKIKTENLFLKSNLFSDCKEIILDINDDQVQKESHDNYLESNQLSNTKYDLLFNENQVKSNPDFRMRAFRNFAVGK